MSVQAETRCSKSTCISKNFHNFGDKQPEKCTYGKNTPAPDIEDIDEEGEKKTFRNDVNEILMTRIEMITIRWKQYLKINLCTKLEKSQKRE